MPKLAILLREIGRFSALSVVRAMLIGTVLMAGACEDDPPKAEPTSQAATQTSTAHTVKWLEINSPVTPAQWMASRRLAVLKSPDDADVIRISADLEKAHRLYRESERMVANRAVQLEGMLSELGIEEPAEVILGDMASLAGEVGQTEGFGAITQHYFNLLSSNISRGEALSTLKSRYGPRP
ncbi:MAG: hypothetical protein ABL907_12490 [Hyphomicrobium sp.]